MAPYSESFRAKTVLLQTPMEVQPLVMALFLEAEEPYNPRIAQAEIQSLRETLEGQGVEVVTIYEALLQGDAEELRAMLLRMIGCEDEGRLQMIRKMVHQLEAEDLVTLLLQRPSLRLIPDPELQKISPDAFYEEYQIAPLFGLMFPRDHFIITNKGLILGNFRRKDRRRETEVVKLALQNIGLVPVHQFEGEFYLEGGDFATTEQVSFIANGMRTDSCTIREMLKQDLFGTPFVVEMVDLLREPEEFHLDHYFNILDETYVAISEGRLQPTHLRCNLYEQKESGYVQVAEGLAFSELASRLSLRVLAIPKTPATQMGLNFLNIGDRRLLCTDHFPASAVSALVTEGYEVIRVSLHEVHKQFGSLHCSTQTIQRVQEVGERLSQERWRERSGA